MDRRTFFKISSLTLGAAAAFSITSAPLKRLLAGTKQNNNFSIELITDDADKAAKLVEQYISGLDLMRGPISYSEYESDKAESGDIVLINDGKLLNYKTGSGDMERGAKEIASALNLPRIIGSPRRLKFSTIDAESTAGSFLVFHKEKLVRKIEAAAQNENISLSGTKGELRLNVSSRKARVTASSCTHKNCVNSGSISLTGESLVCIPNEIHIIAE
jgi:hypothetical protein